MTFLKRYKSKKSIVPKGNIQEEIEKDTINLFRKMDKLFEGYFGKMCPSFEPDCVQCEVNLEYNNFKLKFWEKFIKK